MKSTALHLIHQPTGACADLHQLGAMRGESTIYPPREKERERESVASCALALPLTLAADGEAFALYLKSQN